MYKTTQMFIDDLKADPEKSWVYWRCKAEYKFDDNDIAITIGDVIYSNSLLPSWILDHEETHIAQQKKLSWQVWWKMYFENPSFRLDQELEASRVEYKTFCQFEKNKNIQVEYLKFVLDKLNNFYQPLIKITPHDITK